MKEIGILFSGPMVRAILEGRKTQTRRPMKNQPPTVDYELSRLASTTGPRRNVDRLHWLLRNGVRVLDDKQPFFDFPFGQPGERLWVRETHILRGDHVLYRADIDPVEAAGLSGMYGGWKPSIHMPRRVSRLMLEVIDTRIQRVQDITEEDARAEGVERWVIGDGWREYGLSLAEEATCGPPMPTARDSFRTLWDSIYTKRGFGWHVNPWVWVPSFKVVTA
jgi:hypothetical protein